MTDLWNIIIIVKIVFVSAAIFKLLLPRHASLFLEQKL